MVESVSESLSAAFTDLSSGEESGATAEPAATPTSDQPAAEPEATGDSVRDALETSWTEIETADRDGAGLDAIFQPLADRMKTAGVSRAEFVRDMLGQLRQLGQDPAQGIVALAQHLRARGATPQQAQELIRRVTAELGADAAPADRVTALEDRWQGQLDAQQAGYQQQVAEVAASADQAIKSFAATVPHFDRVRSTAGTLMLAAADRGEELSLEAAYEAASWTDPEIRADLIRQQQAEAAPAAAAAQRESVAKARAAQTPRTSNVAVTESDGYAGLGVRATLERTMAEMGFNH